MDDFVLNSAPTHTINLHPTDENISINPACYSEDNDDLDQQLYGVIYSSDHDLVELEPDTDSTYFQIHNTELPRTKRVPLESYVNLSSGDAAVARTITNLTEVAPIFPLPVEGNPTMFEVPTL